MTLAAITTFTALLLAHILADFVFQTDAMARRKEEPHILLGHVTIVGVLTFAALGGSPALALGVAAMHLMIDALKIHVMPKGLRGFAMDQAAHIIVLIGAAIYVPNAVDLGIWADTAPAYLPSIIVVTGALTAITAGGFVVKNTMEGFGDIDIPPGLKGAGQMIGNLERSIIFIFALIGQPAGIGFLIAAKSILRFDAAKDQKMGEYVIIGTLASFAWAIALSYLTLQALTLAKDLIAP